MVVIFTDNGYQKWYNNNKKLKKKRLNFIIKGSAVVTLLFILFLILNILGNMVLIPIYIFLLVIIIAMPFIKYKHKEFIPCCNHCGYEIKNVNDDCIIGKTKLLGMKGKTTYSNANGKPSIKNVYIYNIDYMCKNCGSFYIKLKKETEENIYGNNKS